MNIQREKYIITFYRNTKHIKVQQSTHKVVKKDEQISEISTELNSLRTQLTGEFTT